MSSGRIFSLITLWSQNHKRILQNCRRFLPWICLLLAGLACNGSLPPSPLNPDVLYQDDFSNLEGGWERIQDAEGITDYDQGGYRIQVLRQDTTYWSHPGLDLNDVTLEVSATILDGPVANLYGLMCRYQDDRNFYFFLIGKDGFFVVGKYKNGEQSFIGMDTFGFHPALQENHPIDFIQVDCIADELTLTVNETPIVTAHDNDFVSGDVGLIAGTFDKPGTDVLFDDFLVRKP